MTLGSFSSCRATASLLFCPPLSPGPVTPPTIVSARSSSPVWKEWKKGGGGGGERNTSNQTKTHPLNRSIHHLSLLHSSPPPFPPFPLSYHVHDLLNSLELLPSGVLKPYPSSQRQVLTDGQLFVVRSGQLDDVTSIAPIPVSILLQWQAVDENLALQMYRENIYHKSYYGAVHLS